MQKFKTFLILAALLIFSFLVLSYKLEEIPNGVYLDEATTGYNAFSILKTGKDEYGKEFPVAFRFFGSYSPPIYTYLTVIPVSVSGLNAYSVRIISIISGSLMILVMYGFLKQSKLISGKIIYFLMLLFLITPWNFFFSRAGYEIYLGFFLFSLGIFFCWRGFKRTVLLPIGLVILSVSTYAAHPQIYSVPVFVLGFLVLFHKLINKKHFIIGLILALIIQIPHMTLLGTQAFLNKSDLFYSGEIISNAAKIIFLPSVISIPLSFTYSFFSRAITYLSPYSLFFLPDPDVQRSVPELSVFYSWMAVPFLTGIFVLLKNIKDNFVKYLILLITVSLVPAALTKDPFSTQRVLSLLLPLFLIICFGLSVVFEKIGLKKFSAGFVFIFLISVTLLWRSYFILLPAERAVSWNYGFKEIAKFITANPQNSYVIEQIHAKPVYIELAFFLNTNPEILQNSVDPKTKNDYYNFSKFNPDYKFGNIETRTIKWEEDIYRKQVLVGDELVVSKTQAGEHFLTEVFGINDPRGYPVLKGFMTDPEKKCKETNFTTEHCVSFKR